MNNTINYNLSKEDIAFLQAIFEMRELQKSYFRQPSDYRLRIAIAKEQKVDRYLKPLIDVGIIKPQNNQQQQTQLFK